MSYANEILEAGASVKEVQVRLGHSRSSAEWGLEREAEW